MTVEKTETEDISLDVLLAEIAEKKREKYGECRKVGIFLFCEKCPYHQDEKYDSFFFDTINGMWRCAKDPSLQTYDDEITLDQLKAVVKKAKQKDIESAKAEVTERHYITNNMIKTVNTEKGYLPFKYDEGLGYYKPLSNDVLKSELQHTYEMIWGQKPSLNLLTEMRNKVCKLTEAGKDLSIFEHDHGDYYYIPFRNVDVYVHRKTGEVKMVPKDPLNRPFLTALQYNLTSLDTVEVMPKKLEKLLELVPPQFRETLLMELASVLAFKGRRLIFINFSRVGGTGKTTLLKRLSELFPGLVIWSEADELDGRFEKSALVGKNAILIDEFEGRKSSVKTQLKILASDNKLRIEYKNGPVINIQNTLIVIVNTNTLLFENFDTALSQRIVIIPFIMNFSNTDEPEEWTEEDKIEIIKWLIKYVLPKYFKKEPKRYPVDKIIQWINSAKLGEQPYDGIEEFLQKLCYKGEEKPGVLVSLKEAYNYYLLWCDTVDYIPVTYQEFVDKLKFLYNRDGAWLIKKGEEEKLCMRKINLAFFMK